MEGFVGTFDGRGHTIDKLHTGAGGLLGDVLNGSVIKNLALTNAKIVKDKYSNCGAGILCYLFVHSTLENVYIDFSTIVSTSGVFGRANNDGEMHNVVIKYTNNVAPGGVFSSWQITITNMAFPEHSVFATECDNVSIIYANGTDISRMQVIGNSTFTSATIKEYILAEDGSLLAITSKTKADDGKKFTDYKTAALAGGEFEKYSETYWDLSGVYPVFK